jgi:glyoxylase-like metal-dependent hydrolase (beta-lactamase superfamily II)
LVVAAFPIYSVRAIKVAEADVTVGECFAFERVAEWQRLAYYLLVIEGENRTIVVNSGPPQDLTALNDAWRAYGRTLLGGPDGERVQLRVRPEERPAEALARAGVDPASVDDVIVTPLASYATGNLLLFTRARFWFSRRGWIDFHAPDPELPRAGERRNYIPDDVLRHLVLEGAARVRLLEDEDEVAPGVETFWVGCHHRSSVAVKVRTSAGHVVHSDCFFLRRNVEENVPIGAAQSQLECYRAYARIRREADVLVPGYDPDVLERGGGVLA